MVKATFYQNQNVIEGFSCIGHADDQAEAGQDVICAGISALVINAINSIDELTESRFSVDSAGEEGGRITFSFEDVPGEDARLLISSMILGLREIEREYGNEYLILEFKEA